MNRKIKRYVLKVFIALLFLISVTATLALYLQHVSSYNSDPCLANECLKRDIWYISTVALALSGIYLITESTIVKDPQLPLPIL